MTTFTEEAQRRLERYLSDVRWSLRGCRSVEPQEVEADVTEHISGELEGLTEPVSLNDLEAVLQKLGSPQQWVPAEELPWWRRLVRQLRTGPADYRLAFISFGLLVSAFLFGRLSAPVLIAASFCVSRAGVAEASDRGGLGPQRWLFYPSLIVVYVLLLIGIFAAPVLGLLAMAPRDVGIDQLLANSLYTVAAVVCLLGLVCTTWPALPRMVFRPFADWFTRKWGVKLTLLGLGAVILCALVCVHVMHLDRW